MYLGEAAKVATSEQLVIKDSYLLAQKQMTALAVGLSAVNHEMARPAHAQLVSQSAMASLVLCRYIHLKEMMAWVA